MCSNDGGCSLFIVSFAAPVSMVPTVGSNDTQTTDTEVRPTPYTKISNEFGTNLNANSAQDLILATDYSIWTRSLHRQGQLDTIIWGGKMFIFPR